MHQLSSKMYGHVDSPKTPPRMNVTAVSPYSSLIHSFCEHHSDILKNPISRGLNREGCIYKRATARPPKTAARPEPTFPAAPVKAGEGDAEGATGVAVAAGALGPRVTIGGLGAITEVVTTGMVKTPEVVWAYVVPAVVITVGGQDVVVLERVITVVTGEIEVLE